MTFSIAADAPTDSPMGLRTRTRRALSSIQAPNVTVQASSSPFSPAPAKQAVKAAPRPELSRTASSFPSEGNNVHVQLPSASFSLGDLGQQKSCAFASEKKSSTTALTFAVIVTVGASMMAVSHINSATLSATPVGRSGYSSLALWRAAAAEEWRLSADAQRLDLTFEEVSATSSASGLDGEMFSWRQQGIGTWRGEAAEEWRHSTESQSIFDSQEPSPLLKWSAVGGMGAWREYAANRWKSSDRVMDLELDFEESEKAGRFSLDTEAFSVSFFPQQKQPVFEWGAGVIA